MSADIRSHANSFTDFFQSLLLLTSLAHLLLSSRWLRPPSKVGPTLIASYPVPEKNTNLITSFYFFQPLGGFAWAPRTSLLWQLALGHYALRGCDSEPHARLFLTIHCSFSFLCLEFP